MSETLYRKLKDEIKTAINPGELGKDPKTQELMNKFVEQLATAINHFVQGNIDEILKLLKSENVYVSNDPNISITPSEKLKKFPST